MAKFQTNKHTAQHSTPKNDECEWATATKKKEKNSKQNKHQVAYDYNTAMWTVTAFILRRWANLFERSNMSHPEIICVDECKNLNDF